MNRPVYYYIMHLRQFNVVCRRIDANNGQNNNINEYTLSNGVRGDE